MPTKIVILALFATILPAADLGPDLLAAAKKGQTKQVEQLIAKGAPVESTDKNGRTPLMLAAQHGHADTVKVLLAKGAKAQARDHEGWSAFGLAVMAGSDAGMQALPQPEKFRVSVDAQVALGNVYNSCFQPPDQLSQAIAAIHPDLQVVAALRDIARTSGKQLIEFLADESGDATLHLKVRPGASCLQNQSDNLTLAIDVRMVRARNQAPMLEKTFGGGLRGMHAKPVTTIAQYGPVFGEWAKSHANGIYSAILEAWLRGEQ